MSPEVFTSVAERASYMLWTVVNNIKIYSRKLGCKASYNIVNDVLNDMDLPPALGALDGDWELFNHKDNDLFFMDKMIELRDEYQKPIDIPLVSDPDFISSWRTDEDYRVYFNKYIRSLIFVILYGDSEAFKDALSEAAFAPLIGHCYRVLLGKVIQILAFKQNDQISERNWRLLRACASNPNTRESQCREELFNLAEILVCQLLGPYESIKIHDNLNVNTPPLIDSPEVEFASDDQDICERDGESDKIIVEIDLTSSDSMEQMELECEINPQEDYIYKLLTEDDDESNDWNSELFDNESEDISQYFATPATLSSVDELCETIGYLSNSSGYFYSECLFHIKRRMERFFYFRNVSTEKEYTFISRLIRGLIALGEFAFREFIPYTYKFDSENIPEYLWSYFPQAAVFLRGANDIFIYEWLKSICGMEELQPFMVYKTRFITRLLARNVGQRKKTSYHIVPKIGVRRLETGSKSDLAIVTDVMLEPTLDEIFPKPTLTDFFPELASRNTRRRRSSIRFKFIRFRPIPVKPKTTKPEQLPQIKTISTNHFSFSHLLNINNNTHNHHNHNYTNWLKPQDVLLGRRRLLKPISNGQRPLPLGIYLTNNI
ncbi:uncharacterized protein LOC119662776 isoform X2 [Teleopsis dalmanni]|nr:uncharacterized protein LOC119662776 isoform X2 [Teleopsis dalmanni]